MGTRTQLRLNHEQRILNSGARLHGAETTPLGASSTPHFIFTATPMPEVLHCTGICTAVQWQMQRAAQTDAAHCGGRCSALRFFPNPPSLSPHTISPVQRLASPIPTNAPQTLHQTNSNSPDTAFRHTQGNTTPHHRAQRPPHASPFRNFYVHIPYYREAKSTKAQRAVGFSGKLFNFAREKGKDCPPSA